MLGDAMLHGLIAAPAIGIQEENRAKPRDLLSRLIAQDCFRSELRLCLAEAVTAAVLVHVTWWFRMLPRPPSLGE